MPHSYEGMRDSLIAKGTPVKEAKRLAAANYNKNRPKGAKPVTGHHSSHKSSHTSLRTARRY